MLRRLEGRLPERSDRSRKSRRLRNRQPKSRSPPATGDADSAAHRTGAARAPHWPLRAAPSLCGSSPRARRTGRRRPPASIPPPPASPPDATVESAHTSICIAAWGWLLFRLLQPPPGSRWEQRFGVALRCRFQRPGVYCVRSVEPSRPVVPGRRGIASILFEVSVPPDSRRLPTPVERGPATPPANGSAPTARTARRTRNRVATGAVVTARQEAPDPSVFVPARSGVGARSERTGPVPAFASSGEGGYSPGRSYPPGTSPGAVSRSRSPLPLSAPGVYCVPRVEPSRPVVSGHLAMAPSLVEVTVARGLGWPLAAVESVTPAHRANRSGPFRRAIRRRESRTIRSQPGTSARPEMPASSPLGSCRKPPRSNHRNGCRHRPRSGRSS